VPLVHLNALFEKIADRKIMGITTKKLYKLILKADVSKQKLMYYKYKLGMSDNPNMITCEDSFQPKRVISRGPFMALFKDEPIKFVNALEAAARPLFKRKKRMEVSSKKSTSESLLLSVKTEPIRYNSRSDQSLKDEKSPKHRKIEDKTGMIIVADVDHDEISTVSVSPTGEDTVCSNRSFDAHLNKNERLYSNKKKKRDSTQCRSTRKSATKSSRRKRRDSLRSVKSVGNKVEDSSVAKSLFSYDSHGTSLTKTSTSVEPSHHRSNSIQNIESIDMHELMSGNQLPFNQNTTFNNNPTLPYQLYPNHQFLYEFPRAEYCGGFMSYNTNHGARNLPSDMENQRMNWHYHEYHPHPMNFCHRGSKSFQMANTIEYEECFIFKGIARFLKKCFGLEQRNQYTFAEQHIPHFETNQAPRKEVKPKIYDDTNNDDSKLLKEIEEKLSIAHSNRKRDNREDVQRVLSFKLKVDDEDITNRPRLYSAPDQKFLARSSDMKQNTVALSSISALRDIRNEMNGRKETEKGDPINEDIEKSQRVRRHRGNKISYDGSIIDEKEKEIAPLLKGSSQPSRSYKTLSLSNEQNALQTFVPLYSNGTKPFFHHYR